MNPNAPALLNRDDGIATLTLNAPARLNALSSELLACCNDIVDEVRADPGVRVLVVRGAGKAFCCGADLADYQPGATSAGERVDALLRDHGEGWVQRLRALPIPVLCAVHGAVAGGGVGFALAADVVVAARSAYFYLPFVPVLGLVPDLAAVRTLVASVGEARTVAAALLGDKISAERAAQWGLVWACVDDAQLEVETLQLARRLAALPSGAVGEVRELVRLAKEASLPEQLAHERERQSALMNGPAFAEGLGAFLARRPPRFHG